ncbi:MAG: metal ABC transporter solute-binding protein, Zn/Mn family, partial [Anaerolineae bacterium]
MILSQAAAACAAGQPDALPTAVTTLTPAASAAGEPLRVVATTGIIADWVSRVGGDAVALTVLVPSGVDPHT